MNRDAVADIFPLSPTQEGMLFHCLQQDDNGLYFQQLQIDLDGALVPLRLRQAWAATVARHAALRTVFSWQKRERPLQLVLRQVELPWQQQDWRALDSGQQQQRWQALLQQDRSDGLHPGRAPLLRLQLLQLGERHWRLLWSFHHLILDGWSARRVLAELWQRYRGEAAGPAPSVDLHGLLNHRRDHQPASADDEAYWHQALQHAESAARRPRSFAAAADSNAPGELTLQILPDRYSALRDSARRQRVTVNSLLCTAWAILLVRQQGREHCLFGITQAGRPADLDGADDIVGLCIQTLPLPLWLDPARSAADLLTGVQRQIGACSRHAGLPLNRIQAQAAGGSPIDGLFDTLIVFENLPEAEVATVQPDPAGIELRGMQFYERSHYPLSLVVVPGEGLALHLFYQARHFGDADAARIGAQLLALLDALANDPQRPWQQLAMVDGATRQQLLAQSQGPQLRLPTGRSIVDVIADAGTRQPDASAIVQDGDALRYREFAALCHAVAARLMADAASADPAQPVALCLPRSALLIVAMIGVLRSGRAYLPLDPRQPAVRIAAILEQADVSVVISGMGCEQGLPEAYRPGARQGIDIAVIESLARTAGQLHSVVDAPDSAPAYLLFTSGSSGQPKGVRVSRRNLLWSTLARQAAYPRPPGRFLLLSPAYFDSSVAGIYWTLSQAGTLVLPAAGEARDPAALAALIAQRQVSHLLALPSLYAHLLQIGGERLTSLRCVIVAGEACPSALLAEHQRVLPQASLSNEYGPTEATVWCSVHHCDHSDATATVPIGRPAPGCRLRLADAADNPLPVGVPGELLIGGDGVTDGYLHGDADDRFQTDGEQRWYRSGDQVMWRPDGELLWLGRLDRQLKVRGHRIEAAEIEQALLRSPQVAEAVVDLRQPSSVEAIVDALLALPPAQADALLQQAAANEIDAVSL